MKVGSIIKAARLRADFTLSELGEKVGSSASTLSALENGQQKNPPSPAEMVQISDALLDRRMLDEYCRSCPVRVRIVIRKFPPLNKIVGGSLAAALKTSQKLAESSESVQSMLSRMLRPDFHLDPEYHVFRDSVIIKIIDAKRGAEILLDQLIADKVLTEDDLHKLKAEQQKLCIQKGYHVETEG